MALENADRVRAQPWVRKLKCNYRLGEIVPPTSSHAQRFRNFVVAATDREALARRIEFQRERDQSSAALESFALSRETSRILR